MLIFAMLLATQQPTPAPASASGGEDDIVVLARRLRSVRWSYDAKDGAMLRCTIKRSGGAVADALVCDASRQCAAENPTFGDRHLVFCIKARVGQLFAERRAASARQASQS